MAESPTPATPTPRPEQPAVTAPLRKRFPLLVGLVAIVLLFGLTNLLNLVTGGNHKPTARSTMPQRPATANPQQVSSFETQQALVAQRDAQERQRREQLLEQMRQLQEQEQATPPGPEGKTTPPMTAAQRATLYGNGNPNAPQHVSGLTEAQAQAKQRALLREKQHQEALNSSTVAIDFGPLLAKANSSSSVTPETPGTRSPEIEHRAGEGQKGIPEPTLPPDGAVHPVVDRSTPFSSASEGSTKSEASNAAFRHYDFDSYEGRLYRVFEGTVFEGVVTNHIDGGLNGPILIMLTTDYYSHDHQHLLLPQGTRLLGTVGSVNGSQQRKLLVVFHRAVCPDGFSVALDKFPGLDPLGTTGLATQVNHGYFTTFAAAAAIGGLGGLAQIGNGGIGVLGGDPSIGIRNGISTQSGQEAEQILNHFLNRLPVITLKEGSRARVYIGRDLLLPSYDEHRVDPAL